MAGLLDDKKSLSGLLADLYENPVVNTAIGFTPVLGDVQSGYETVNSARKGNYGEAALNALGLLPYVPSLGKLAAAKGMMGIAGALKASHGSPYKFDAFDFSKIGAGEGSKAFGHGLYFAQDFDSPVARPYANLANRAGSTQAGLTAEARDARAIDALIKLNANQFTDGDVNKLADFIKKRPGAFSKPDAMISRILEYENNQAPGYMYNTLLKWPDAAREAADPLGEHHLLDWNAPLSEQSDYVLSKLGYHNKPRDIEAESKAVYGTPEYAELERLLDTRVGSAAVPDVTGGEWYRGSDTDFLHGTGKEQGVSEYLNSLGIPGLKHFEPGSRSQGGNLRNYVIFDDKIPKIVSRNGKTLLED